MSQQEEVRAVAAGGECRMLALSAINVDTGFNPRRERDPERFAQLVASVRADGVLQPILVTPNGQAGGYRLVAGEGRYLAAGEAGQVEVPCYVRAVDGRTGGLELALAENLGRDDLDPVEEAHAYRRLRDAGLTKKGIAERLGIAQKRVTERLQILDIPAELHPQIATGEIPPSAVKALVALTRIHPGLPGVVAARVVAEPAHSWSEPVTWADVVADPIGAVLADDGGDSVVLPDDVFDASETYPLSRFALSDKARRDLKALCRLLELEPEHFEVRFGREAIEHAAALGAAHPTARGWDQLIVGADVAAELAAQYIAGFLRTQRELARREREDELAREAEQAAGGATADGEPTDGSAAEPSETELREQRRAERAAQQQARQQARSHNEALGRAVLKHLARLKVDADVLRVLAAVDVGGDLGGIAARGARLCLPGWPVESQRKNGTVKVEYLDKPAAEAKAREFVAGAGVVGEIAGRLMCLIALARYADEQAVAQSARSFYHLKVGRGLPFGDEVEDLIDAVCGPRLPDELTGAVRTARAHVRAAREQAERERTEALARLYGVDEQRLAAMTGEQREQVLADARIAYGAYSVRAWDVEKLVRAIAEREPAGPAEQPVDRPVAPNAVGIDADEPAADEAEQTGRVARVSRLTPAWVSPPNLLKGASMSRSHPRLSEADRAARRQADRERLERAARELLTSEGWQRWVRVRASNGLGRYSFGNQLLIALQRPDATFVAGFRAFLKLNRCVRRGEKAIRILAPMTVRDRDAHVSADDEQTRTVFRAVPVFDVAQTDPLPGTEPVPLEPPRQPISGDSHGHLLTPLENLAAELGYTVRELPLDRGADGWCDAERQEIVVNEHLALNARVRVLVHELAHALGVGYRDYGRRQAEVLVDTVTYVVLGSVGLDVSGESVPYIAGWGETGALDAIRTYAETIDHVAKRIETALAEHAPDDTATVPIAA